MRKSNQTILAPLPENEAPARALFSFNIAAFRCGSWDAAKGPRGYWPTRLNPLWFSRFSPNGGGEGDIFRIRAHNFFVLGFPRFTLNSPPYSLFRGPRNLNLPTLERDTSEKTIGALSLNSLASAELPFSS